MKYFTLSILLFFVTPILLAQVQLSPDSLMADGIKLYNDGNYKTAITVFDKCVTEATNQKKLNIVSNAYNNMGNCFSHTGETDKSIAYYFSAIKIAEQIGDKKRVAKCLKNIGTVYSETKDFKKAFDYFNQSLAVANAIKDNLTIADCYNNMGLIYDEQQHDYPKALEFYNKALDFYRKENNQERMSMSYNNLGIVYKYLKDYKQAIFYYDAGFKIARTTNDSFMIAANLTNIGNTYSLLGEHNKAMECFNEALIISTKMNDMLTGIDILDGIANEYFLMKNYKAAFDYRKKYEEEKFNYFNTERTKQMEEMDAKYKNELKQREIDSLSLQKEKSKTALLQSDLKVKNRNLFLVVAAILFLGGVLGFLVYRRNQQIRLEKEKADSVLQTEITERQRIARDMHDELGSGLSKIAIAQLTASQNLANADVLKTNLQSISKSTTELVQSMGDLIWSLKSEENTLDHLLAKIRMHSADFLDEAGVQYELNIPDDVQDQLLKKDTRHHLYLTFKEALNNAVKHSAAKNINVTVSILPTVFSVKIKDDGKGFNAEEKGTKGNGLGNMKQRIESVGGTIVFNSNIGHGTEVLIEVGVGELFVS